MKLVLALLFVFSFAACSSHREKPADVPASTAEVTQVQEVQPEYGGKCAMGLCNRKDMPGDAKYSVDYKNKRYLFGNADARDRFISDIEGNIKKADEQWAQMNSNRPR